MSKVRLSSADIDTLADIAESTLGALAHDEILIAESEARLTVLRRQLKGREGYLWLSPDGAGPNPAIDGKNAEIRSAQHGAICAADPEVLDLASRITGAEVSAARLQATARATKRAYALALEILHTRRAELYLASGRYRPENRLPRTPEPIEDDMAQLMDHVNDELAPSRMNF